MSKAEYFRSEAEKTAQSVNFGLSAIFGFGRSQKLEEAAELYIKAGNAFKLDNQWQSAGDMFILAAKLHEQTESPNDSINDLVNAAQSYKKVHPSQAIPVFLKAINKYNENGRFGQSAKFHQEIAEMYDADDNAELAVKHYNEAANLFNNDNKSLSAQPCYLKIASISAKNKDYSKAADIYERIGRDCLQSRLGAYSAKGNFFQCVLCYLASGDSVASNLKLQTFKEIDHNFPISRECGFIEKLLLVNKLSVHKKFLIDNLPFNRFNANFFFIGS